MSLRDIEGAGHHESPLLRVRQVLMEGLVQLAGDRTRLEELFGRVDDLLQGTQTEYTKEFSDYLQEKVRALNGPDGVRVRVGYPHSDDMALPHIGIVVESGSEDTGGDVSGDLQRESVEAQGTAPSTIEYDAGEFGAYKVVQESVLGIDWTSNVQITCWALSGEEAELWKSAVLNVLIRDKGRLQVGGIREIRLSESGFMPSGDYQPRVMYVPVVRVTASWTVRQTMRQKVPYAVKLGTRTYGNG